MEKGGIYALYNIENGKIYVGQTKNLIRREKDHFRDLRKGRHHNKYLQRAYQKYGENAFKFIILERCTVENLDKKEKEWIEYLGTMDRNIGYNLESGGNVGKEVSEAVREAKRGENNPMFGKHLPKSHIESLRIKNRCHNSSLSEKKVLQIKQRLLDGTPAVQIMEEFDISRYVLYSIRTGKNFGWVRKDLTDALKEKDKRKKEERNQCIIAMESEGFSRSQIAEAVGCEPATVTRVIGKRSDFFIDSDKKTELKQKVVEDYLLGIPRKEIMEKYGIRESVYVRMISDAYNEKRDKDIAKAIELRSQGVMVKDIAKQLGYARTTITRWTLEAENEQKAQLIENAIAMRKNGMKVEEISERLNIHRTTISRWTKELQSSEYRDNHSN